MDRIAVLLVLFVAGSCLADYAPGWHEGHRGIDRPGFDFETTESCGESTRCCFDRCASTPKCEAWTLSANQCNLKSAIPTQVKSSLNVTSGVKRASAGLRSLLFKNYQLGTTEPTGWLRTQLVLTANGQAGHLELFWDDVMDSVWIGGVHDHSGAGHERGPCMSLLQHAYICIECRRTCLLMRLV